MKICKDVNGFFVLDNANQVVNLYYEGDIAQRLDTITKLGLCYWHSNEKYNVFTGKHQVLVDNITSWKALKWELFRYIDSVWKLK